MREDNESEKSIRRLLLGESGEEEQQHIEELFMTDPEYQEKVLMAENDLIEDYLENTLSESESEIFRRHFLSTPQQRQKVRIARLLRNQAAVEVIAHSRPGAEEKAQHAALLHRLIEWLRLRQPLVYVPLAGALVVAVIFGTWRLVELRRAQQLSAREESQRLEVERELAQLNDLSGAGGPPPGTRIISTALPPLTLRGTAKTLPPLAETGVVELWLLRDGAEYPSYSASLQKVGSASRFSITNLRAANTAAGRAVPVKLPTRLVMPGTYQIMLSGLTLDGRLEEVGEYTFQREK